MGHEIDLGKYKTRTDLAIEAIEGSSLEGITQKIEEKNGIKITEVVVDEKGSKVISKKPGNYITIEFEDVTDYENGRNVEQVFSEQLKRMLSKMKISENASCLVIGLGNSKSTPDALGPLSIDEILVTNHLFSLGEVEPGFRPVAAFTPGVMGQTGLETSDMILGVVNTFQPDFIIVIDALASQSVERVNRTIQMTDSGIHPGSGIGNSRKEISKDTLHIPVLAIGIPTVVDAVTIVSDTIKYMHKHYSYSRANKDNPSNLLMTSSPNYLKKKIEVNEKDKETLLGIVGTLKEGEVKQLLFEVLTPIGYNLMVTPKEVDFMIEKLSIIIGTGVNNALHENVNSLKNF